MAETMQGMETADVAAPKIEESVAVAQPSLAEAATTAGEMDAAAAATKAAAPSAEELAIARELVRSARACGVALTGPNGLLKALTKTVIETALDEEMTKHLGYDEHAPVGRGSGNSRNGTRPKRRC
jgi:putative transposase